MCYKMITITRSTKSNKKLMAKVGGKTVHFGQKGADDYTTHGDEKRKQNYIKRHRPTENWGASGIDTAGFYSRHVLWNQNSITKSIKDMNKKFGNKFIFK